MKATLNGTVIAEANKADLIYIEQRWYFPPESVDQAYLRVSSTPYTCPWKGVCQYSDVRSGNTWVHDAAWTYPSPLPTSLKIVKKDYSNYVAFWRDVEVSE
ncbi:MAG: DUF427 domain-containing protein [Candidatus Saccharibacteria bacterium]